MGYQIITLKRGQDYNNIQELAAVLKRRFVRYFPINTDDHFDTLVFHVGPSRKVYKKERFSGVILK